MMMTTSAKIGVVSTCRGTWLFFVLEDVGSFYFFFQAEDGIRDYKVTGVQTCALPILQMGEFPRGASIIPNPVNRIPGFSVADHHFVPGFPQMAWPMVEWLLETRYRDHFDRQRWAEASIFVYEAGESQLIAAMQTVEREFKGLKVFSLPSMGADGSRIHVELGVRGDPAEVAPAMERLRREVASAGFPYK